MPINSANLGFEEEKTSTQKIIYSMSQKKPDGTI